MSAKGSDQADEVMQEPSVRKRFFTPRSANSYSMLRARMGGLSKPTRPTQNHSGYSYKGRYATRLSRENPGGLSSATLKILSSANPTLASLPSSNSCPISVTPCGTRRGGENFGKGCCGSGAQSLRASDTSTKPARKVNDGCPVELVMTSISSRNDGTSNRSTSEKMRAIS